MSPFDPVAEVGDMTGLFTQSSAKWSAQFAHEDTPRKQRSASSKRNTTIEP